MKAEAHAYCQLPRNGSNPQMQTNQVGKEQLAVKSQFGPWNHSCMSLESLLHEEISR
jgi:hypothetical protein